MSDLSEMVEQGLLSSVNYAANKQAGSGAEATLNVGDKILKALKGFASIYVGDSLDDWFNSMINENSSKVQSATYLSSLISKALAQMRAYDAIDLQKAQNLIEKSASPYYGSVPGLQEKINATKTQRQKDYYNKQITNANKEAKYSAAEDAANAWGSLSSDQRIGSAAATTTIKNFTKAVEDAGLTNDVAEGLGLKKQTGGT